MLYNLAGILAFSKKGESAVAAFNVFGYEDASAVVRAAEREGKPVILMANRDAVDHMGTGVLAGILLHEAREASVPVCVHLDHAIELPKIEEAIKAGFSSVMIDASMHEYDKNVALTRQVVQMAAPDVGVEAEIGSVGYSDLGTSSVYTEPEQAVRFAADTGVDALAVAVGTVHRMVTGKANLQLDRLAEIAAGLSVPIVIHGSTGVSDSDLRRLVDHGAQKINLGTTLRMEFGQTLRRQMDEDPTAFDRIKLFKECMAAVQEKAAEKIRLIS